MIPAAVVLAACVPDTDVPFAKLACEVGREGQCPDGYECVRGLCCKDGMGCGPHDANTSEANVAEVSAAEIGAETALPTVGRDSGEDTPANGGAGGGGAGGADGGGGGLGGTDAAVGAGGSGGSDAVVDTMPDVPCPMPTCMENDQRCSGDNVETCVAGPGGCPAWGPPTTCPAARKCIDAPKPGCACPPPTNGCGAVESTTCSNASTLLACISVNGCIVGTTTPCPGVGCVSDPIAGAKCGDCPPSPEVCENKEGTSCSGGEVATCSRDGKGCLVATTTPCEPGTACTGPPGQARCVCTNEPPACASGVGRACDGNNLVTCRRNASDCLEIDPAATVACSSGCVSRPGDDVCYSLVLIDDGIDELDLDTQCVGTPPNQICVTGGITP
jgi:hypothetical protein